MTDERLEDIKKVLQDACDRDWKDETLWQTANIAANAIYWRGREIKELKAAALAYERREAERKLPRNFDDPHQQDYETDAFNRKEE